MLTISRSYFLTKIYLLYLLISFPRYVYVQTVNPIPNRYTVVLKDTCAGLDGVQSHVEQLEAEIKHKTNQTVDFDVRRMYSSALIGYTAILDDLALSVVKASPDVVFVENDQYLNASALQVNSPWNLGRVNSRSKPSAPYSYKYDPSWGAGVTAYILDTGINTNHIDFGGRATTGVVVVSGENATDCIGHGTHVAGIVGSKTYGISRSVSIVGVKVFILSGPYSSALNTAVANVVSAGIAVVVAAGNNADDACKYSPSSAPTTICVGATNSTDYMAPFSNYGNCVNLFAPGASIRSTFIGSNNATALMSGTSMAAPHVSGVLAAIQSKSGPNPYPVQQLRSILLGNATSGILQNVKNTKNLLLFNSYES
ncbi:hypothetical protein BB560_005859 [Smittium megazygosporum]|uniref:Peptidase S8/S53 domain-containing protein n=1 Tax=Smittium megazygosporum TaxID=133381 RepID=A0A2T9YSU9_9FUNG|nr:hypothetical protein BB560_005859 [Smittium megazygosporum]